MVTNIRPEQPQDAAAITHVTELAFRSHPHSDHAEHLIISALRCAGQLTVSLVAEQAGQVVGHVGFSPVQVADSSLHWYGLGPIAVLPERQGQGIGQALIERGLAALRPVRASGCVVLGDPRYYGRFGFTIRPECFLAGVPAEYFQVLPFGPHRPVGEVTYHEAFRTRV